MLAMKSTLLTFCGFDSRIKSWVWRVINFFCRQMKTEKSLHVHREKRVCHWSPSSFGTHKYAGHYTSSWGQNFIWGYADSGTALDIYCIWQWMATSVILEIQNFMLLLSVYVNGNFIKRIALSFQNERKL